MRSQDLPPDQRTILITGCASGIGQQCALTLHQKGYRVMACVRQAQDKAFLEAKGLTPFVMDLSDSDSIKLALKQILKATHQQLFALFNNAGFGQPGAVEDLSREALRQQFETNVFGTQELTNLIIPIMRQQGYGRIIQNSSLLGLVSMPFRGAYNASKHALEALTDTLRLELKGTPLKISTLEPGPIQSNFRNRAYQRLDNIDTQKSRFHCAYLSAKPSDPPFTQSPTAIAQILLKILTTRQPAAHYYITFPTYALTFLKRFLPSCLFDRIILHIAGKENILNPDQ